MVYRRRKKSKSRKSRTRRRNPARRRSKARRRPWNKGKTFSNYKRIRSHKRRVNPRRRRSVRRRNPGFLPTKGFAMSALGIVGGFVAASFAAPLYGNIPLPKMVAPYAPGILNLLLGYFVSKQKLPMGRDIGIGIAAAGAANLLSRFISLPGLGVDLSDDGSYGDVVRVGDEVVRVGTDLSEDLSSASSVYEMV